MVQGLTTPWKPCYDKRVEKGAFLMVITLVHGLMFLMGPGYVSDQHGCVYGLIDDALFYTPQFTDGSYSSTEDDWVEVDHMALLGEDQDVRLHVEWVEDMLRREANGIFADPVRMY